MRVALVAGETSGDLLGAGLVRSLSRIVPEASFEGVAGPAMQAAGCKALEQAEVLAVMGLIEPLKVIPRLLRLRSGLVRRWARNPPDVFVGIDAPDFNLGLEIKLRKQGMRTVQYVSPTVWAWREKRVKKIARAADLVLCLFPFEPRFYSGHQVPAAYVGHPLADQIEPDNDRAAARLKLGLNPESETVCLLPGSRHGEVSRLAEPMIGAARLLAERRPNLQFACATANTEVHTLFRDEMARLGFNDIHLVSGDPRTVIAAADTVLCASGTATLETMLVNRPLVMTYRVSPTTFKVGKSLNLVKLQWYSLPNILAGEALVPELIQEEATPERLAAAAETWLDDAAARENLRNRFLQLHRELRRDAGRKAAQAVAELLKKPAL